MNWILGGTRPLTRPRSPPAQLASSGGTVPTAGTDGRPLWGREPPGTDAPSATTSAAARKDREQVSPEHSLKARHPALAAEWDRERNRGLDPAAISTKSKHKVWWRCGTCGHGWAASVQNRTYGHGCPRCGLERRARTQSHVDYDRSLAARHPGLIGELHPTRNAGLDPELLGARSSLKVWWRCGTLWSRMAGRRRKPHVRRHRLPSLRAQTPRQDAEQGGSETLARGQAPRDRCPTTSLSQPGHRSRAARRAIEPKAVVAVRHLWTRVEDRRLDAHGRLRMPSLLSSESARPCGVGAVSWR